MNRSIRTMAAAWLMAAGLAAPAAAQDYPTQTIRMISSFGAGGGSDIIARILAQRMQEKLGQNVIVENRPGAGGLLGNEVVANSPEGWLHARRPDRRPDHRLGHHQEHALRRGRARSTGSGRSRPPACSSWCGRTRPTRTSSRWSPPPRPIRARSCSAARASPRRNTSPANCSSRSPASNCCTCPIAPRRRCSRRCSPRTSTWWSTRSRRCSARSSPARSVRSAVTGKDRFPTTPNIPPVIESGVVPGYDVNTWYGLYGPKGMPPAVDRQAQQDAQRDARRSR